MSAHLQNPPGTASVRAVRAAVFTLSSMGLGLAAHHIAARRPMSWTTTVTAAYTVFVGALPWTGRARSLPAVATATFAAQLALHAMFDAVSPMAHHPATGHASLEHAVPPGHGAHLDGAVMVLGHVLAASAVAVLLHDLDLRLVMLPWLCGRFTDAARSALRRWLRRWRFPLLRLGGSGDLLRCPGPPTRAYATATLDHVLVRRGPPHATAY